MSESTDLFGHPIGPSQLNLFGDGQNKLQRPAQPTADHAARARAKLTSILKIVRAAQSMPWSDRDTRMWQTVFPQMANWLPDQEAEQLVLEFHQQIERLKAA